MNIFYRNLNSNKWTRKSNQGQEVMIDLAKPQVFISPLECWVSDDEKSWYKKKLTSISRVNDGLLYMTYSRNEWKYVTLIDPNPKERIATREEVLHFLETVHRTLRVRYEEEWNFPQYYSYHGNIEDYEWIEISSDGDYIGEPKQFIVVE